MKKIYFLLLSVLLTFSSTTYAQDAAFREGELSINPGLSLGLIGYGYGYYGASGFAIPLSVDVGYGITEYISVGGYLGYMGRSYGPAGSRDRLTVISVGAQGAFHVSSFLNEQLGASINDEKLDLYVKVILGVETSSWSNEAGGTTYYANGSELRFGPTLGTRYMFSRNLGVFGEIGRGTYGYLTFGLSFRM